MSLLNRSPRRATAILLPALHSTMSLLNRVPELAAAYDEETLHSTMSLLNPDLQIVLCQEKVQIKYNQFSLFM